MNGEQQQRSSGDITGSQLQILLNWPDKDTGQSADHPIPQWLLPANLQTLLKPALSQIFDQFWSQKLDQNRKTKRDLACDQAIQAVVTAVRGVGSGYSAYNIQGCGFPATGQLYASVEMVEIDPLSPSPPLNSWKLVLGYSLPGESISFAATTPYTGGVFELGDPTFKVTFDAGISVEIPIPDDPSVEPLVPKVFFGINNANISSENLTAYIAMNLKSSYFAVAQTLINQGVPLNDLPLGEFLGGLTPALNAAASLGFINFQVEVNPNNRTLIFRLIHPWGLPPVVWNDASGQSLFRPVLNTSPTQGVHAGEQLVVNGIYFEAAQGNELRITWNETLAGRTLYSELYWGFNDPNLPLYHVILTPPQNYFDAKNLNTSTDYKFRVRDCDQFTCCRWSDWKILHTQYSDQVSLWLDDPNNQVGTATLQTQSGSYGGFSTTITIPNGTPQGKHVLTAEVMGGLRASTTINVLGPNQTAQPIINVINPNGNIVITPPATLIESYPFTVSGESFSSGLVNVFIDNAGGQSLGSSAADISGNFTSTFTWPFGMLGPHNIMAVEVVGGQTMQASVSVKCESRPS
jgi:hypothetical protein